MIDSNSVKAVISDLNAYFIDKILNKEFFIEKFDRYYVVISIDGYKFTLWIPNGKASFRCYDNAQNFMQLSFSETERDAAYGILYQAWQANEHNTLLTERAALDKRIADLQQS